MHPIISTIIGTSVSLFGPAVAAFIIASFLVLLCLRPLWKSKALKRCARGLLIDGMFMVHDIAIPFRMGAGFAGDVNRSHPASIEPVAVMPTSPPTAYGQAVVGDVASQGVRPLQVGDSGTSIYGVTVRSYPTQQTVGGMNAAIGFAYANPTGVQDVIKRGYVLVPVVGVSAKFGPVYIWTAASTGAHFTGGFEAASSGGNTALLANATWNGGPDATGIAELILGW